jgi:hypothetical protein
MMREFGRRKPQAAQRAMLPRNARILPDSWQFSQRGNP